MDQKYVCTIPMMPVRREPGHRFEMVSMLLFGETFQVLESQDNWHKIHCLHDDYKGWITARQLDKHVEGSKSSPYFAGEQIQIVHSGEHTFKIDFGSRLLFYHDGLFRAGEEEFRYDGKIIQPIGDITGKDIVKMAEQYMGTPYLWGGRCIFGIDCSGLTQMVYRLNGIPIPRDAWQQAEKGESVGSLDEAIAGDLAFFAEKEKVSHVGVLTGDGHIVHASETVRKDKITDEGIYNKDLRKFGLKAISIKRFINLES